MGAKPTLSIDVAGVYVLELTVNDGVQDSRPESVRIVAVTPASGTGHVLSVPANDLVAAPGSGVLYASVPSTSTVSGTGNRLVVIDAETGSITRTVFVGSEPGPLALSDDGRFLYVGLLGSFEVRRVDLTTFTAGPSFGIPLGELGYERYAGPMAVLPGRPDTVVVSTRRPDLFPSFGGIVVFDSGVARPTEVPERSRASRLVGGSGNTFYGYDDQDTGFGFYVLTVDASGVSVSSERLNLFGGFDTDIIYEGGWVIASDGQAVDVADESLRRVGTFPASGPTVAADSTRVYFLSSHRPRGFLDHQYALFAFDRETFLPLGEESMLSLYRAEIEGEPADLVRWGTNGVAFRTTDPSGTSLGAKVYILTSDLVVR